MPVSSSTCRTESTRFDEELRGDRLTAMDVRQSLTDPGDGLRAGGSHRPEAAARSAALFRDVDKLRRRHVAELGVRPAHQRSTPRISPLLISTLA